MTPNDSIPVAAPSFCADLAHAHPLPEPGCRGTTGKPTSGGGIIASLRVRVDPVPDVSPAAAFPGVDARLSIRFAGVSGSGAVSVARQEPFLTCSAVDRLGRHPDGKGDLALTRAGADLDLHRAGLTFHYPKRDTQTLPEIDLTRALAFFPWLDALPANFLQRDGTAMTYLPSLGSLLPVVATALLVSQPAPAAAQLPGPDACFALDHDPAPLARDPLQRIAALRLWFLNEYRNEPDSRIVIVQAVMADLRQGGPAGANGMSLRSTLYCRDDPGLGPACFVECDGGYFTTAPLDDGGLQIETERLVIGLMETCGGSVDLSAGQQTTYRLAAAPAADCADLARIHDLPVPGCYGVAYSRADAAGTVAALQLRLEMPEYLNGMPAFPWLEGVMAIDIAPGAQGLATMAGARVMLPIWCGSESGTCQLVGGEGAMAILLDGPDLMLETAYFPVHDPNGRSSDLTRGTLVRHILSPITPEACAGLVLE